MTVPARKEGFTHEAEGLLELIPEFWGKPRMASLLCTMLARLQEVEDATWGWVDGIDVDDAERWVLDRLAKVVGEPRRPADDEALRTLIKGRIAANRSSGTFDDLNEVAGALGITIDRVDELLLELVFTVSDFGDADPSAVAIVLDEACLATVGATVQEAGTIVFPSTDDTTYSVTTDKPVEPDERTDETYGTTWTTTGQVTVTVGSALTDVLLLLTNNVQYYGALGQFSELQILRGSTQIYYRRQQFRSAPTGPSVHTLPVCWMDRHPGAGNITYTVQQKVSGGTQATAPDNSFIAIPLEHAALGRFPSNCTSATAVGEVIPAAPFWLQLSSVSVTVPPGDPAPVLVVGSAQIDCQGTEEVTIRLLRDGTELCRRSAAGHGSADWKPLDTIWLDTDVPPGTYTYSAEVSGSSASVLSDTYCVGAVPLATVLGQVELAAEVHDEYTDTVYSANGTYLELPYSVDGGEVLVLLTGSFVGHVDATSLWTKVMPDGLGAVPDFWTEVNYRLSVERDVALACCVSTQQAGTASLLLWQNNANCPRFAQTRQLAVISLALIESQTGGTYPTLPDTDLLDGGTWPRRIV